MAYFAFTAAQNFHLAYQLARQEESVQKDTADLQQINRQLSALRDYLNSDEYIELAARQQLGWVRPGETAIIMVTPTPAASATPDARRSSNVPRPWWQAFFPPKEIKENGGN